MAIVLVILGNPFGMELAQPLRDFLFHRVLLPSSSLGGKESTVK
jgi:hypothetical protein